RIEARASRVSDLRSSGVVVNHNVSCTEYQGWLVEALAQGSLDEGPAVLRAHPLTCPECAAVSSELRESWDAFGVALPLDPPAPLKDKARDAVLKRMAEERAVASRRRWLKLGEVPLAVVSGLLVTAATLSLLSGLIWGSTLPQGHLFFCAAIFTGLLVGAF